MFEELSPAATDEQLPTGTWKVHDNASHVRFEVKHLWGRVGLGWNRLGMIGSEAAVKVELICGATPSNGPPPRSLRVAAGDAASPPRGGLMQRWSVR
jgi:hypothetical protein